MKIVKKVICGIFSLVLVVFLLLIILAYFKGEIDLSKTVIFGIIAVALVIWGITCVCFHYLEAAPFFVFIFFAFLYIFISTLYLGTKSPDSIFNSISSKLQSVNPVGRDTIATTGLIPSTTSSTMVASKTPAKSIQLPKVPFLAGDQLSPREVQLYVVGEWTGAESKKINFNSTNPPYVVNVYTRKATSTIKVELNAMVYKLNYPYQLSELPISRNGIDAFIISQKGEYVIDVRSTGCSWTVVMGNEKQQ